MWKAEHILVGHDKPQWTLNVKARIQTQASPYGVFVDKVAPGRFLTKNFGFHLSVSVH